MPSAPSASCSRSSARQARCKRPFFVPSLESPSNALCLLSPKGRGSLERIPRPVFQEPFLVGGYPPDSAGASRFILRMKLAWSTSSCFSQPGAPPRGSMGLRRGRGVIASRPSPCAAGSTGWCVPALS